MKQWYFLLGFSLIFTGCFSNRIHLNRSKVLAPGHSEYTWGLASLNFVNCHETQISASGRKECLPTSKQSTAPYYAVSRSYRLGLLNPFWVFTGLDFGYQVEIPHSTEFDLRLGLPSWSENWTQSFSAGWAWGLFVDNSYYAEYALARHWGRFEVFSNFRITRRATLVRDTDTEGGSLGFGKGVNDWISELGLGTSFSVGEIPIVPDRFGLSLHTSFPKINFGNSNLSRVENDLAQTFFVFSWGWDY